MEQLQKLTLHLTARTKDSAWLRYPMPKVWSTLQEQLLRAYNELDIDIDIISLILMRNHYHLLIKAKLAETEIVSRYLLPEVFSQKKVQVIQSKRYLYNCYKYIYQNPKRARIVNRIENYPYSTLFKLAKGETSNIPLVDKLGPTDEYKLHWLNKPISSKDINEVRQLNALSTADIKSTISPYLL